MIQALGRVWMSSYDTKNTVWICRESIPDRGGREHKP